MKIVLVTGGVRSGKSSFAERYVAALGAKTAYIATAQALDSEMAARIALHRQRRPADWLTYEAPENAKAVLTEALGQAQVVLFDCLTLYISNLLFSAAAPDNPADRCDYVRAEIAGVLAAIQAYPATVVFVTNEVGSGIVPENALAREYRDLAGMVNQQVAAAANEVYLMVSGLAVEIKRLAAAIG